MRWRVKRLSSQIFLAQLAILSVSTAVGFGLFAATARGHLDEEFQARAAAIAQTFAQSPPVQDCVAHRDQGCDIALQKLATITAARAGAAFIVVIDQNRVRLTHPDPALIGQRVSEPMIAADGQVHLRVDNGAVGATANAIVPLYDVTGAFIGEVSVGITEDTVTQLLLSQLPSYAAWFVVALLIGAVVSFGLASLLKRRTFGLELHEIARLLQEREATLHGIREGVVAIDPSGRISVVNDEAKRLLRLAHNVEGRRVEDVLVPGPVRDALTGTGAVTDASVVTDDFWLVLNRMPVILAGRPHGVVVTMQDRTAIESVSRELAGERSFTESLRAQQHEFTNRIQGIAGLLELDRVQEALDYVHEIRGVAADLDHRLREHIASPQIIGLMLGKAAEASERGIELIIDPETRLAERPDRVQALVTVLGNLIDNAFDALAGTAAPRRVIVRVVETEEAIELEVDDSGPGIPDDVAPHIFRSGFTTKRGGVVRHSGLGLFLVSRTVQQAGGTITVSEGPGAAFTVVLPRHRVSEPAGEATS
jgi:two-component system CitB family sensor kinase